VILRHPVIGNVVHVRITLGNAARRIPEIPVQIRAEHVPARTQVRLPPLRLQVVAAHHHLVEIGDFERNVLEPGEFAALLEKKIVVVVRGATAKKQAQALHRVGRSGLSRAQTGEGPDACLRRGRAVLPQPAVHGRERLDHAIVLRACRLDVLPDADLPVPHGLLDPEGRGRDPAGGARLGRRGAARRDARGSLRREGRRDGIVLILLSIEKLTGNIVSGPDIISRGFVFEDASQEVINDVKELLTNTIKGLDKEVLSDSSVLQAKLRSTLKKYLRNTMERRPMIMPIIFEV